MSSNNIVNIGDKIDIRMLQQKEQKEISENMKSVYKSSVQDIKANGLLEISMPTNAGKMVLLSIGVRYECSFYTSKGLYSCVVQVRERYKIDGLYMLLIEMKTSLEKVQRREYYRLECAMDMEFLPITEEEARIDDIEKLKHYHKERFPDDRMLPAIAVDLSGGGIRFVAEKEGQQGEFLLVNIILYGIDINQLIEVTGRVLSCKKLEGKYGEKTGNGKYEYRLEFSIKDPKKREIIIKYIFEQERRNRQKG